jgi:hypothetical protein
MEPERIYHISFDPFGILIPRRGERGVDCELAVIRHNFCWCECAESYNGTQALPD